MKMLVCFLIALMSTAAAAKDLSVHAVSFEIKGSAPPVREPYGCADNLKARPYDEEQVQKCLKELLSSKFFQAGKVSKENIGSDAIDIVFHLESPKLLISTMEFKLSPEDRDALQRWVARDDRSLRLGSVYTRDAEAVTFYGIQQFFRSQGRAVLSRSILRLDYSSLKADLSYEFVEGPRRPQETAIGPYGQDCPHRIQVLDLTGVDDNVPIPLIDQITRVRAFTCFDQETLKSDQERLLSTGFFTQVRYSTQKSGQDWDVRLECRGAPVAVNTVKVKGYGADLRLSSAQTASIPLIPGQPYTNSAASNTASLLEGLFRDKEHRKVTVLQDVSMLSTHRVDVQFNVLLAEDDEIYINGKRF